MELKEATFDFLIYTAPLKHAHKYVTDLTISEKRIFEGIVDYAYVTTLHKGDPFFEFAAYDRYASHADGGSWNYNCNYYEFYKGTKGPNISLSYQFYNEPCVTDPFFCDSDRFYSTSEHKTVSAITSLNKLKQEYSVRTHRTLKDADIIGQYPWPYFPHFESRNIAKGYPWDLFELQGLNKVFWLGASASFETVEHVIDYNLNLLEHFGLTNSNNQSAMRQQSIKFLNPDSDSDSDSDSKFIFNFTTNPPSLYHLLLRNFMAKTTKIDFEADLKIFFRTQRVGVIMRYTGGHSDP
eukprot:TRINITY_DN4933_c0_g1_i1.p1 TRINITY_DN4933_c0_g1~~TRINITY_DN4933_c0_g1_i1.p1  ORF type:complete len:307 (-),score=31.89 TRINITY_DN4933_c0_g1_i1:145-1029(-)